MTHNYGNCGIGDGILRPDDVNERITNLEDVNVKQTIWEEITAKGIDETVDQFNGKTSVDTTIWDSSPYNAEAKKISSGGAYTGEDIFTASGTHIKAVIDANGDYLLSGIPNPALYPRYSIVYNRKGTAKEFGEEEIPSGQIIQTIETPTMVRDVENAEVRPKNEGDNLNMGTGGFLDSVRTINPLLVNRIEEKKQQHITVAKDGGDFETIQGAIDSITDATSSKVYIIKVFPGIYIENVTLKNYIDIQGSGLLNTVIQGNVLFNLVHNISDLSFQKTITTSETILDASTVSGGGLVFTNILIVILTSTINVKPIILSVNKGNFTTIGSFQINYVNTSNDAIASDTHLVELLGNGTYIFLQSFFNIQNDQSSGNLTCVYDNNAGTTRFVVALNDCTMSNASWDGIYRFNHHVNNTSNKHLITTLEGDIKGVGGLGKVYFLHNNSGGSITRILSSRVFMDDNFSERCVARAESAGDIIDFSFCEKSENIPDAEAFCGNGKVDVMARNDGEFILKNTNLVDLDTLIGLPTFRSLQDMFNINFNAGWINGQTIADNLDGTTDMGSGSGYIREANTEQAELKSFDIDAVEDMPYDIGANYVYNYFNAGSPIVDITQTSSLILNNENDKYELFEVVKESDNTLHISPHFHKSKNIGSQLQQYLYSKNRFDRADAVGGWTLGESGDGVRNVSCTGGIGWIKLNKITLTDFDTAITGNFDRYYTDGIGGFTKTTGNTTWDNTQYDLNGTLTLVGVGKYSWQDLYREADDDVVSMYGNDTFNSIAGASVFISYPLPVRLQDHARFVGRIVFRRDGTVATAILSPFTQQLEVSGGVDSHNNLAGLQGGVATEYYHLNAQDYADISGNTQLSDLWTTGTPTFAELDVDNINIDGNTVISTDVDGDINITPNGDGEIVLDNVIHIYGETFENRLAGGGFKFICENSGGSPEGGFIITHGLSGQSYNTDVYTLTLDGEQTLVNLLSENSSNAGFVFGDSDDADVASIQYSHNADRFDLRVNNNPTSSQQWLSGGEVLLPLQPAFEANRSNNVPNVTGNGNIVTVIFNNETSDVGGNYNPATGVYTASVSGYHEFTVSIRVTGITSAHTAGLIYLNTSNKRLYGTYTNPTLSGIVVFHSSFNKVWMDAGDTASGQLQVFNGARVVNILGSNASYYTYFHGGLEH